LQSFFPFSQLARTPTFTIRPKSNQLGIARYLVFCVDKDFKMEGSSLEMEDASHGLE
jgi:hypothetical protein